MCAATSKTYSSIYPEKFEFNKAKERTNEVNEIEVHYIREGIYGQTFMEHLMKFIGYVLNRYSGDKPFPEDMINFTYIRIMERLGGVIIPEPDFKYPVETEEDIEINMKYIDWYDHSKKQRVYERSGRSCLYDPTRSNLGNYIYSIARNAHSNYTYHNSKKLNELEAEPMDRKDEESEERGPDSIDDKKLKVLTIKTEDESYLPLCIRRFITWLQNY